MTEHGIGLGKAPILAGVKRRLGWDAMRMAYAGLVLAYAGLVLAYVRWRGGIT